MLRTYLVVSCISFHSTCFFWSCSCMLRSVCAIRKQDVGVFCFLFFGGSAVPIPRG